MANVAPMAAGPLDLTGYWLYQHRARAPLGLPWGPAFVLRFCDRRPATSVFRPDLSAPERGKRKECGEGRRHRLPGSITRE